IKAKNVVINQTTNETFPIDWGGAMFLDENPYGWTQCGLTVAYLPPKTYLQNGRRDGIDYANKATVYSLGILLNFITQMEDIGRSVDEIRQHPDDTPITYDFMKASASAQAVNVLKACLAEKLVDDCISLEMLGQHPWIS